jgi:hypothetical protein
MLIHDPIIIIDQKTRTKELRSTRDTDKANKRRRLLWLCCSQFVSLTDPANREVMSAERMMAAERFDVLKDHDVRSFSV